MHFRLKKRVYLLNILNKQTYETAFKLILLLTQIKHTVLHTIVERKQV